MKWLAKRSEPFSPRARRYGYLATNAACSTSAGRKIVALKKAIQKRITSDRQILDSKFEELGDIIEKRLLRLPADVERRLLNGRDDDRENGRPWISRLCTQIAALKRHPKRSKANDPHRAPRVRMLDYLIEDADDRAAKNTAKAYLRAWCDVKLMRGEIGPKKSVIACLPELQREFPIERDSGVSN